MRLDRHIGGILRFPGELRRLSLVDLLRRDAECNRRLRRRWRWLNFGYGFFGAAGDEKHCRCESENKHKYWCARLHNFSFWIKQTHSVGFFARNNSLKNNNSEMLDQQRRLQLKCRELGNSKVVLPGFEVVQRSCKAKSSPTKRNALPPINALKSAAARCARSAVMGPCTTM